MPLRNKVADESVHVAPLQYSPQLTVYIAQNFVRV